MKVSKKTLYIIVAALVVIGSMYYLKYAKKENYNSPGHFDVSLDDRSYESISPANDCADEPHFADVITGDAGKLIQDTNALGSVRPSQRLDREAESRMMPRTSKQVTPFNIDVADPKSHFFQVNLPRVQLKDPQWLNADPYRGDIPIKFHPNVPLVSKSRYGTRSSWRGDGYFSDYYKDLYGKYTGTGYLNKPIHVVNEETIMDATPTDYIH